MPEVLWPQSIDLRTRLSMEALAADLSPAGGLPHVRARRQLVEEGYPALFAILARLRTLDYLVPEDAMFGFELNKLIEEITGGLHANYSPVQAGEQIPPAKAEWNTRTVIAWDRMLQRWPDRAAFERTKQARSRR